MNLKKQGTARIGEALAKESGEINQKMLHLTNNIYIVTLLMLVHNSPDDLLCTPRRESIVRILVNNKK